ncbi:MAG: hypothetical protein OXB84_06875, partial [Halobacteriovoraceae bacterium]|nr:hypothetical protein [Halobacteriovoraceae bacterium]
MNILDIFPENRKSASIKCFFILSFIFCFLCSFKSHGVNLYFCDHNWESLPIRQDGRVKPLLVHAKESIKYLTGKTKIGSYSAVQAYCLLSLRGMGLNTQVELLMPVEHEKILKLLELEGGKNKISYDEASSYTSLFRREMAKTTEGDSLKAALKKHLNQLALYRDIAQGTNWMFAGTLNERIIWMPLPTFITEEKIKQTKKTGVAAFKTVMTQSKSDYIRLSGDDYLLELGFVKANLTWWTMLAALLALAGFFIFKNTKPAMVFALITLLLQISIIVLRVLVSGRAPITNMYETVLFSGFAGLVIAILIGFLKKEKIFVIAGLSYNICTLWMLNFANNMLSPRISPLVPVLRDNFW